MTARLLETLMLLCFGASWPLSVLRSWKARTARGKSLAFLLLIESGYVCGLIAKIVFAPDFVIFFYALNFLMVGADVVVYFRNRLLDRQNARSSFASALPR